MKNSVVFIYWAALYLICALLGLFPMESAAGTVLSVLMSALFFLPGGVLVYRGIRKKDRKLLRQVRIISALSLLLTMILLIASFLSVMGSPVLGNVIHILLTLVSVPMISSGYWFVSLFLWACLLISTWVLSGKRR